jgi:diacylglycerol kinase family enzyme
MRRRLPLGAHLPHPGVKERRAKAVQVDLGATLPIRLDGELVGSARAISVRLEEDAIRVVV